MTISCNIAPDDIWLAHVFFSDKPQTGKARPILAVSLAEEQSAIIAAKITTSPTWPHSEYVFIPNWSECCLRKPSYVQLNPLFEVERAQILRNEPLGHLSKELLNSIIERLNAG